MGGELNFKDALRRQQQLNVLTWIVILALIAGISLIVFAVAEDLDSTAVPLLANQPLRVLLVGFLVAVVLYLADQHSRLQTLLRDRDATLQRTSKDLEASRDALEFAHQAAIIMGSKAKTGGLQEVLRASARRFGADVTARVGDDLTMATEDPAAENEAAPALISAAVQAVAGGSPLSTCDENGAQAVMAVPLRVQGKLRDVLCTWRRQGEFTSEQLDGLVLVGRIIELSLENDVLEGDARSQLVGTLSVLESLVESRLAATGGRSAHVTDLALALGDRLGYDDDERDLLRVASMTHDIGMLEVPDAVLCARRDLTQDEEETVRAHAERGARLAGVCAFPETVGEAILAHHEHLDGSGYPRGLRGKAIPLDARIIAVCDAYHSMTTDRPFRARLSRREALSSLRAYAGTWYDEKVVASLVDALGETLAPQEPGSGAGDVAVFADEDSAVLLSASAWGA